MSAAEWVITGALYLYGAVLWWMIAGFITDRGPR